MEDVGYTRLDSCEDVPDGVLVQFVEQLYPAEVSFHPQLDAVALCPHQEQEKYQASEEGELSEILKGFLDWTSMQHKLESREPIPEINTNSMFLQTQRLD